VTTVLNPHPVRRSFVSPSLGIIFIHLIFLLFSRGNVHTLFGVLGLTTGLYIHFTGRMTHNSPQNWFRLLPFVILFLPFVVSLKIVFVELDETTVLTVAWAIFCGLQSCGDRSPEDTQKLNAHLTWAGLFVIWSAFLWLIVIWEVGTWRLSDVQKDRLGSVIFPIWETNPVKKHMFLGFLRIDDLDHGRAYSRNSPFYLLLTYLCSKVFQFSLGLVEIQRATRLLPFLSIFVLIGLVLSVLKQVRNRLSFLKPSQIIFAFLGLGYLLSDPALIIGSFYFHVDTVFPISIYLIVMISRFLLNNDYESRALPILVIAFSLINPINAFLFFLITPFFVWRDASSQELHRRSYIKLLALGFSVAVITLLIPALCIALAGYTNTSSSYLFRSGLDGSMARYQNIIQAFVSPSGPRPWSIWPPIILFLTILLWIRRSDKNSSNELFQIGYFLLSNYAINIVLFPQSISVHPYLYDYLFTFPLTGLGLAYFYSHLSQSEMKGPALFACFLAITALVLYNLTTIAQLARSL
jgi:hypothetical protein